MKQYYDYKKDLKGCIECYLSNNNIILTKENYDNVYEDMFISNEITGNETGSYTCDDKEAKENVLLNMSLCVEACQEFGVDFETFGKKIYDNDYNYLDVTIRCYLLSEILSSFITD